MTKEEVRTLFPGDLLIGNELNTYGVTCKGAVCSFVGFSDSAVIWQDDKKNIDLNANRSFMVVDFKGCLYPVFPVFFDIYKQENVKEVTDEECMLFLNQLCKESS
jgi:hypothetical protein